MARILIVDDSRLIAHVAKTILTKQGHEVILAQDGLAGLQAAKSEHPDLILLDLIMPVMDGYQVCQGLKEEPWIFHISAGEFCDAAQEALLSLQRQAVIVFSQAMGKNTTIARIETATAQIIYGV